MSEIRDEDFKPIDAAAKNGSAMIVRLGPNYAKAKWHHDMWAYDFGPGQDAWHQIDFEPTHYTPIRGQ